MLLPTYFGPHCHSSVKNLPDQLTILFYWASFRLCSLTFIHFDSNLTMAGAKPITPKNETKQNTLSNIAVRILFRELSGNGWG